MKTSTAILFYFTLARTSQATLTEETRSGRPPIECIAAHNNDNALMDGFRCRGSYCGNIRISCAFPNGQRKEEDNNIDNLISIQHGPLLFLRSRGRTTVTLIGSSQACFAEALTVTTVRLGVRKLQIEIICQDHAIGQTTYRRNRVRSTFHLVTMLVECNTMGGVETTNGFGFVKSIKFLNRWYCSQRKHIICCLYYVSEALSSSREPRMLLESREPKMSFSSQLENPEILMN